MFNRRILAATILVGVMASLSACSSQTGIAALEREATPEDALPAEVALSETINLDSARFLVSHEQNRYFAAVASTTTDACIIVVPHHDSSEWFAGCGLMGGSDVIVTASTTAGSRTASLVRDDADTRALVSEGWNRIHDNVLIPAT